MYNCLPCPYEQGGKYPGIFKPTAGRNKCSPSSFCRFTLYPPGKKPLVAIGYSPGGLSDAPEYVNCSRLISHPDSSVVNPL
jgi:hypothetical protein